MGAASLRSNITRTLDLLARRTPELLCLFIVTLVQFEQGWNAERIRVTVEHTIPVFLITLALTFVLLVGEINLAVTSTMAASGVLFMVLGRSLPPIAALSITLLIVGMAAWLYGYIVAKLRVNSLALSLGVMFLVQYIVYWQFGHLSVESEPCLQFLGIVEKLFSQLMITLVVGVLAALFLSRSNWGLWFRAVGDDAEGFHRLTGRSARVVAMAFAFSGMLSVVAGLIYTAKARSAQTGSEQSLLFWAIGAALVGGVRLAGGLGSAWMALRGAALVSLIVESLDCLKLNSDVRQALFGALIVAVVAIPAQLGRRLQDVYHRA